MASFLALFFPQEQPDEALVGGCHAALLYYVLLKSIPNFEAKNNPFVPFFQKCELFLTLTIATPPYGLELFGPTEIAGEPVTSALEPFFTFPFNMTGQPAASIPLTSYCLLAASSNRN
jgi:hypothetical protein